MRLWNREIIQTCGASQSWSHGAAIVRWSAQLHTKLGVLEYGLRCPRLRRSAFALKQSLSRLTLSDTKKRHEPSAKSLAVQGAAFAPSWSPDGKRIAFGYGGFLQGRRTGGARIILVNRDGTGVEELTPDMPNAGFPSWSADGKEIVYRSFAQNARGLRIINVDTHATRELTNGVDNLPYWAPDGSRILFTREESGNFDIYTIQPDGSDIQRLTTSPANDAHAVWSGDGKYIMWNSGEYGFRDEAALYDNSFQPYGFNWIMNADGTNKRQLTESHWEDSMPCFASGPHQLFHGQ